MKCTIEQLHASILFLKLYIATLQCFPEAIIPVCWASEGWFWPELAGPHYHFSCFTLLHITWERKLGIHRPVEVHQSTIPSIWTPGPQESLFFPPSLNASTLRYSNWRQSSWSACHLMPETCTPPQVVSKCKSRNPLCRDPSFLPANQQSLGRLHSQRFQLP